MRLIEMNLAYETQMKINKSQSLFFGSIFGVIGFIFGIMISFVTGLILLVISFVIIYLLSSFVRNSQTKAVFKRVDSLQIDVPYLEVTFNNEAGILMFYQDMIVFKAMIRGSTNKEVQLPVTPDLFMAFGEFKQKKRYKYQYGGYTLCHTTFREMPHGVVHQFCFFDVDGLLDKVGEVLNSISQFNAEKYQ